LVTYTACGCFEEEMRKFYRIAKHFGLTIIDPHSKDDRSWIRFTSDIFASSKIRPIDPYSFLKKKDNLQEAKEILANSYKIHIMPKPKNHPM